MKPKFRYIDTIYQYPTSAWLVNLFHSKETLHNGTLACPCSSHNAYFSLLGDAKSEIIQRRSEITSISHCNINELYLSFLRPVGRYVMGMRIIQRSFTFKLRVFQTPGYGGHVVFKLWAQSSPILEVIEIIWEDLNSQSKTQCVGFITEYKAEKYSSYWKSETEEIKIEAKSTRESHKCEISLAVLL